MKTRKHLYDNLVYDSKVERNFATELEASDKVAVYVKLPNKFLFLHLWEDIIQTGRLLL